MRSAVPGLGACQPVTVDNVLADSNVRDIVATQRGACLRLCTTLSAAPVLLRWGAVCSCAFGLAHGFAGAWCRFQPVSHAARSLQGGAR